jgi:hypothetical protein
LGVAVNGSSAVAPVRINGTKVTTPNPQVGKEFGVPSVLPGGSWLSWGAGEGEVANTRELIPVEKLVEMRRKDGQARALLRLVQLPLRLCLQRGEFVEPEGGGEAEAEFANQMWDLPPQAGGMTTSANKFYRHLMLAVCDGFAAFEEVRHVPEDGPLQGKITLRKMAYRDPLTLTFRLDDKGGFNGLRQKTRDGTDVVMPREKTWVFTCQDEENPWYGVSYFESAYPHYDNKKKLYYIAHLAAQFAAIPGRMGEYPEDADPAEVTAFRQALASFAFNTAMTFPTGYKVTPFSAAGSFDFLKLIEHHNHMMAKSVLAGFMDTENRTVLIENGKEDASADLFLLSIESLAEDIAESITHHLLPKYIDWNFGSKKYPIFKIGALSDSERDTVADIFKTAMTSSVLNVTPEMVRELEKKMAERLGLDIDYEEIEQKEQAAAEQAEAARAETEALDQAQAAAEAQAAAQGAPGAPAAPKPSGGPPAPPQKQPNPAKPPVVAASGMEMTPEQLAKSAAFIDSIVLATAQAMAGEVNG